MIERSGYTLKNLWWVRAFDLDAYHGWGYLVKAKSNYEAKQVVRKAWGPKARLHMKAAPYRPGKDWESDEIYAFGPDTNELERKGYTPVCLD